MKDPTRAPGAERFVVIEWTAKTSKNSPYTVRHEDINLTAFKHQFEQGKLVCSNAFEISSNAEFIPDLLKNVKRRIWEEGLTAERYWGPMGKYTAYETFLGKVRNIEVAKGEVAKVAKEYINDEQVWGSYKEYLLSLCAINYSLYFNATIEDSIGFVIIENIEERFMNLMQALGKGYIFDPVLDPDCTEYQKQVDRYRKQVVKDCVDGITLDFITIVSAKSLPGACGMRSGLLRLIAEYVEKKSRGRYYEIVTNENNKLLAPFRVFGDGPENIEDASGDNTAIQAEGAAGGDPADKLEDLPDVDREAFKKMLKYAEEIDGSKETKDGITQTDHFKRPENSFRSVAIRDSKIKIEAGEYELGKVGHRYWIKKKGKGRNRCYWVLKQ